MVVIVQLREQMDALTQYQQESPDEYDNFIKIVDAIHNNFEYTVIQLLSHGTRRGTIQVPIYKRNAWILQGFLDNPEWMSQMGLRPLAPDDIIITEEPGKDWIVIRATLELVFFMDPMLIGGPMEHFDPVSRLEE